MANFYRVISSKTEFVLEKSFQSGNNEPRFLMPTLLSDQIIMTLGVLLVLITLTCGFWNFMAHKIHTQTTGIPCISLSATDLILFTLFILFYSLNALCAATPADADANSSTLGNLVFNCILQISFLCIVLFRLWRLDQISTLNLKRTKFSTIIGYPLLTCIGIIYFSAILEQFHYSQFISELTGAPLEQEAISLLKATDSLPIVVTLVISAGIIAPVVEELVFRAYIYPILKKSIGIKSAMVLSALLFGIVHASLVPLLPLSLLGLVFAILYEKCNTIWAPIMAHALFNNLTLLAILYARNL